MTNKIRIVFTTVLEYEPETECYDPGATLGDMARNDFEGAVDDPVAFITMEDAKMHVQVFTVEDDVVTLVAEEKD